MAFRGCCTCTGTSTNKALADKQREQSIWCEGKNVLDRRRISKFDHRNIGRKYVKDPFLKSDLGIWMRYDKVVWGCPSFNIFCGATVFGRFWLP